MLPCVNTSTFKNVATQDHIFVWHIQSSFTHLFDGEVINEVVVVLVEAAVQGDAVRVDKQVLQSGHALQAQ